MNNYIAKEIYRQLGGNRFTVCTGAKGFIALDNGLRFHIGRNKSKANRVEITLNGWDTYDVKFIYFRQGGWKVDHKRGEVREIPEKREIIWERTDTDGIYCDMLEDIFTMVTGLVTHL